MKSTPTASFSTACFVLLVGCGGGGVVASVVPHSDGGRDGSAGGSGGSGGSGGRRIDSDAMHVVEACSAGQGTIDAWQDITFSQISSEGPQDVVINPLNTSVLYVSGNHVGIFKSSDCGATWTKVNTGKNGAALDSGAPWNMKIDPEDPQIIYAINGYGSPATLFKSTNGGVDWTDLFPDGSLVAKSVEQGRFTQELAMDPNDPLHLTVSFHANCTGAYAPSCLGESRDGGATWRLLKSPVDSWEEGASPIMLGGDVWMYSSNTGLYRTGDDGATWQKVGDSGGHQAYRSKSGTWFVGSGIGNEGVQSSADGIKWSWIPNSGVHIVGLVGDGNRIFGSNQWPGDGQPYWVSSETSPTNWTQMKSPNMSDGGDHLKYDPDHHLLFSTNHGAGLWRVRTY